MASRGRARARATRRSPRGDAAAQPRALVGRVQRPRARARARRAHAAARAHALPRDLLVEPRRVLHGARRRAARAGARAGTGGRPAPGELSLDEVLAEIAERTDGLVHEQSRLLDELLPSSRAAACSSSRSRTATTASARELAAAFLGVIFPVLTPLAVGPGRPFPYISNLSLSLGVLVRDPLSGDRRFARVKVPEVLPRSGPSARAAATAARAADRCAPRHLFPGHGDRGVVGVPGHARR